MTIRIKDSTTYADGKQNVYIALPSTDTKPTDVATGSTCVEVDTGKHYVFDEDSGEWTEEQTSGGGGGGGGDWQAVEVLKLTNYTLPLDSNYYFDTVKNEALNVSDFDFTFGTLKLNGATYTCKWVALIGDDYCQYMQSTDDVNYYIEVVSGDTVGETCVSVSVLDAEPPFDPSITIDLTLYKVVPVS